MTEKIANTVLISSSEHDDFLKQISTLRVQLQNCVNHLERATVSDLTWYNGPPPKDGATYLVEYASGIICSAKYRRGGLGEPNQIEVDYRCDCCGKYATPIRYARL